MPAKVSLKFVVILPPTTMLAFETLLIFFLIKTTGVTAIAIIVQPIMASCHELYKRTPTSPTKPKNVAIKDFKLSIILFEAASGSERNLVNTSPEEFTS